MTDHWVNRWKATGSTGEEYTVAVKDTGAWGCSCPAWKFAKAPKPDCKHIRAFKENLNILPPAIYADRMATERQTVAAGRAPALGVPTGGVSAIAAAMAKVRVGNDTLVVESILLQPAKRKFRTIE